MLISFSKRFIFIANTKAASITIEKLLKRYSNIALTDPAYGKHFSYARIVKEFGFIFKQSGVPAHAYFRFGVVREPLEWVVSWYNYRQRGKIETGPRSCQGISFSDFAREVMLPENRRPFAKIGSQSASFEDADGGVGVDYLIPLPRLSADLRAIGEALDLKQILKPEDAVSNVSPKIFNVRDMDPETAKQLRVYFARDAALFKKAEEGGFGDVSLIIRSKQQAGPRRGTPE